MTKHITENTAEGRIEKAASKGALVREEKKPCRNEAREKPGLTTDSKSRGFLMIKVDTRGGPQAPAAAPDHQRLLGATSGSEALLPYGF